MQALYRPDALSVISIDEFYKQIPVNTQTANRKLNPETIINNNILCLSLSFIISGVSVCSMRATLNPF